MFSELEGIHPAFREAVGTSWQGHGEQRFHFKVSQKVLVIFPRRLHSWCNPRCIERLKEKRNSPIPRACRGLLVVGQLKSYQTFVSNEAILSKLGRC